MSTSMAFSAAVTADVSPRTRSNLWSRQSALAGRPTRASFPSGHSSRASRRGRPRCPGRRAVRQPRPQYAPARLEMAMEHGLQIKRGGIRGVAHWHHDGPALRRRMFLVESAQNDFGRKLLVYRWPRQEHGRRADHGRRQAQDANQGRRSKVAGRRPGKPCDDGYRRHCRQG